MGDNWEDFDSYLEKRDEGNRAVAEARKTAPSKYQGLLEVGLRRRQEEKDDLTDQLNRKRVKREVAEDLGTKIYLTKGYKEFLEQRGKKTVEEEQVDFQKFWSKMDAKGEEEAPFSAPPTHTTTDREKQTSQIEKALLEQYDRTERQDGQTRPPREDNRPVPPPPTEKKSPLSKEEKLLAAKAKFMERKKGQKTS